MATVIFGPAVESGLVSLISVVNMESVARGVSYIPSVCNIVYVLYKKLILMTRFPVHDTLCKLFSMIKKILNFIEKIIIIYFSLQYGINEQEEKKSEYST